jgi:hypothetical protein
VRGVRESSHNAVPDEQPEVGTGLLSEDSSEGHGRQRKGRERKCSQHEANR